MRFALGSIVVAGALLAGCDGGEEVAEGPAVSASAGHPGKASQRRGNRPGERRKKQESKRPGSGAEVRAADSYLGEVLFDGGRRTLYYFDSGEEERGVPECYAHCAAAWPPLAARGRPQAGEGVEQRRLGTVKRDDGIVQVTYRGRPLYLYAHERPRFVTGHNVPGFGGLWRAVQPSGKPVR